jgi:hypothetical protein
MPESSAPLARLKELQPDHVVFKVFGELDTLAGHDRACIVVAHGFLELLVNILVKAKCKSGPKIASQTRDFPHSVKLTLLHELGVIGDADLRALTSFRKLRNRAVHDAHFQLTSDDLAIFKNTSFADSEFHVKCMVLLAILWNQNQKLFSEHFFPSVWGLAAQKA